MMYDEPDEPKIKFVLSLNNMGFKCINTGDV